MAKGFSENLSDLRREIGMNQRAAASKLKISQALLSHYENGVREPGLDFVSRACEFYGVSADYLLGRTTLRYTAFPVPEVLPGESEADYEVRTETGPRVKAAVESAFALFNALVSEDQVMNGMAFKYLSCAEYRLMRRLGLGEAEGFFDIPREEFAALCDAAAAELEYKLQRYVSEHGGLRMKSKPSPGTVKAIKALISREEKRLSLLADNMANMAEEK